MTSSSVSITAGPAEVVADQRAPRRLDLRSQGIILVSVGIVLVLAYGMFISSQREKMLEHYVQLEDKQKVENQLYHIATVLFRVDREVDHALQLPDPRVSVPVIASHVAEIERSSNAIVKVEPELDARLREIATAIGMLADGDVRANLLRLGMKIHHEGTGLDSIIEGVARERSTLSDQHQIYMVVVMLTSAAVSIVALAGFGAFVIYFFTRLRSDLRALNARARAVELGQYSNPLPVNRGDEVGDLIDAMNRMASTLKQREKDLAISRQRYFHEEKMTTVKSLAAGIAHEVGNPLETILIVAQKIADAKAKGCESKGAQCNPGLVIEQTRRIGNITREISNFTSPNVPYAKLQDLNELIRGAGNFIRYDRRYRSTELELDLQAAIPAVRMVGDQFLQVMLNLLINAADACEGCRERATRVVIRTRRCDKGVTVSVIDNGCGMSQETLDHAFDAFFTTKPADQGSGLGLAVCKSIIEANEGSMRLASEEGIGSTVEIFLPAD